MPDPIDPQNPPEEMEEIETFDVVGEISEPKVISIDPTKAAFDIGRLVVRTFTYSIAATFLFVFFEFYFTQKVVFSLELFKALGVLILGPLGFVLAHYFQKGNGPPQ